MDFKAYTKIDAVHWTALKHMAKSPLHYKHAVDNPSEDTTGRLKGRGTHTAVLEPDRFLLDYALFKGKTRRGKDWEAFKAMHAEDSILKRDEYEHCLRVAKRIREHPAVAPILAVAKREHSIEWVDEETGLPCKARIDLLTDNIIGDVKGVKSTDLRLLATEIAKSQYHCQLALYREGMRVKTGRNLGCLLVCAEHSQPHGVAVVRLNDEGLYQGWETVRLLLKRVAECQETGRWPDRNEEVQDIELPAWLWPDDEQVMSAEAFDGDGEVIDA